jgi:hypothetical protein
MRVCIPSVNYADYLATVLPAWRAVLPKARFVVVTSPNDPDTVDVARAAGAEAHVTDAFKRTETGRMARGKVFNKARALDEAFGIIPGFTQPPDTKEYCLALDADVYPGGVWSTDEARRSDTIYGCARYRCETPAELQAHLAGETTRADLELIPPRNGGEPERGSEMDPVKAGEKALGYFQLFRYTTGRSFGNSRTAGKYDLDFARSFEKRKALDGFYVLHLGELSRQNWQGTRVLPPWGSV